VESWFEHFFLTFHFLLFTFFWLFSQPWRRFSPVRTLPETRRHSARSACRVSSRANRRIHRLPSRPSPASPRTRPGIALFVRRDSWIERRSCKSRGAIPSRNAELMPRQRPGTSKRNSSNSSYDIALHSLTFHFPLSNFDFATTRSLGLPRGSSALLVAPEANTPGAQPPATSRSS
jgi:hypothetical protein